MQTLDPLESIKAAAAPMEGVYTFSGLNFCIYLKLLRRLVQLVELDDGSLPAHEEMNDGQDDECGICMARPQDTVLPCLHGVCTSCEERWVEIHMDCPFCRQQYTNQRRRKKDQWQVRLHFAQAIVSSMLKCFDLSLHSC